MRKKWNSVPSQLLQQLLLTLLRLTLGRLAFQGRNSLNMQLLQQLLCQLQHQLPQQLLTLMPSILTHLGLVVNQQSLKVGMKKKWQIRADQKWPQQKLLPQTPLRSIPVPLGWAQSQSQIRSLSERVSLHSMLSRFSQAQTLLHLTLGLLAWVPP